MKILQYVFLYVSETEPETKTENKWTSQRDGAQRKSALRGPPAERGRAEKTLFPMIYLSQNQSFGKSMEKIGAFIHRKVA